MARSITFFLNEKQVPSKVNATEDAKKFDFAAPNSVAAAENYSRIMEIIS
tara:strand:+ start:377 stop:526 length:150 start_codon:yes stop_codon:yes gene_type:complete